MVAACPKVPTFMPTVEVLGGHTPFAVAHCNTLNPAAANEAALVAMSELVIIAVPVITVQDPVPTVTGVAFKLIVGEEIQID